MTLRLAALLLVATSCAGTPPSRPLATVLAETGLGPEAPVVVVDIDDTIYERDHGRPLPDAAASLNALAEDHLIVYLTARPTYAKVPGVTQNRSDSKAFLEEHGFPDGPLFTSSLCNFLLLGQGDGKVRSFEQLREYGVERVVLAVGDKPHDVRAYRDNGAIPVNRVVIVLIEDAGERDKDRKGLPHDVLENTLEGEGSAWERILAAYRSGALEGADAFVVTQQPRD